ncbi:limonene-1,2-epoxide hydrolase family protein [Seongchinamella sediminis]|nr:nuclear transport factor 2 family protein [Seongchinamella sediminis]
MKQARILSLMLVVLLGGAGCAQANPDSTAVSAQPSAGSAEPKSASAGATGDNSMTDSEKLAVAQSMLDAWSGLDWERVYQLFGEHGALHNVMLDPIVGEDKLRQRLQGFETGLSRMDFIVLRMGLLDGNVVIERLESFDFNGKSGIVPVVGVMTIEDGQVRLWREYYDRNWLLSELGLVEGEPAHPVAPDEPAAGLGEMSDADKLAVAQAMLDAYEALDWDKVASLIARDGVVHYVEKEPMHGPEAMRAHIERVGPALTRVAFKDLRMGVIDGVVMIERVDDFDYNGHHVSVPVFGSMEIADGKIKVWREYYDHEQMRRGMGLIE